MNTVTGTTIFRWAVAATLGVTVVVAAIYGMWLVHDLLVLAVVALFIAVSLDPPVRWMVRHRVPRPLAVTIIFLFALFLVAGIMSLVLPALIREARQIPRDLPGYIDELNQRSQVFRDLSAQYGLEEQITRLASDLPRLISGSVINFFGAFIGVIGSTVLVLVLTIYFMAALPRIRHAVPALFPHRLRPRAERSVDVVVNKVGSYMVGSILIATIAGTSAYIVMLVFQVPFALPLALLVMLTGFIPFIGATLGASICVIVAAITNDLWPSAILLAMFFLVYQQVENFFIQPRIQQGRMNLPAYVVLLAGLGGAAMLGLVGALMAIPVAAAVKAVIEELRAPAPVAEETPEPATETQPEPEPEPDTLAGATSEP